MDGSHFLDEDIPDPTDFPETAPGLRQLDDALRCSVCRELFLAPVTVNCPSGHCFCSSCIRTAVSHTSSSICPLCRENISEMQLRRNQGMEDVVKAWKEARPFVLNLVTQKRSRMPSSEASTSTTGTVPSTLNRKKKKRKLSPGSDSMDEDVIEVTSPKKRVSTSSSTIFLPPSDAPGSSTASLEIVSCPICNKSLPYDLINPHIDRGCPSPTPAELERAVNKQASSSKTKQKEQWSKLFGPVVDTPGDGSNTKGKDKAKATTPVPDEFAEALPKSSYDTLKTKRLKEMLQEHDLPTTGEKVALVARHERWVILYNANRDASASQRKSLKQLRDELRRWEDATTEDKRKKAKHGELDAVAHQETHKTMFVKLTEAAKQTGRRAKQNGAAACADSTAADEPPASQTESSQQPSETTDDSNEDVIVVDE